MGLASGKPAQHIGHRDPHVADARTAAALTRINGYDVLVVDASIIASFQARRSNVPHPAMEALDMIRGNWDNFHDFVSVMCSIRPSQTASETTILGHTPRQWTPL